MVQGRCDMGWVGCPKVQGVAQLFLASEAHPGMMKSVKALMKVE